IILYTRVIGTDTTVVGIVPYKDYFYIEITDELGFDAIKKAVEGYCWFLKTQKYPDMAAKPYEGADLRQHPVNMDIA
ncbi:hypothetical protein GUF51_03965, partial [Xanthomonas citri pv. citri]|nr:hypothetical protein [Xanthomonas citri pv. citri]